MIYERIKKLCKNKGISINKLELELNISQGSLCKIDKNKPSSEKLQKIADYFNVTVDYLMTGEDSKYSDENAHLVATIINDLQLQNMIKQYLELSDRQKKNVCETVELFFTQK